MSRRRNGGVQTVLGAGGDLGTPLAKELRAYTDEIRLVSRNPRPVVGDEKTLSADLLDAESVLAAVRGSDVVYLVAGLAYRTKVWRAQWPLVMRNTLDAVRTHGACLVFFDNVYSYDPASLGAMTESAPIAPSSRKGAVRAEVVRMLWDAVEKDGVNAMVVRSADFYGPGVRSSALNQTVLARLKAKKKAIWFADPSKVHSQTYVPDAARATALLGNTPDVFGQVWHAPTDPERITGRLWVERLAAALRVEPRMQVMSRRALRTLGVLVPLFRELSEMVYQYERDYFFDSSKFRSRFPSFPVTTYAEGIRASVRLRH